MSGYIDNYRLDLSPAVQALKSRMEDRKNQRESDLSVFNSVAKLMGNVTDSAYKSMEQNKAEIDQLMASEDGISEEELLARYPQQKAYITSLFKKANEEEETDEHRRWAEEEMSGYVPLQALTEDYAQRPAFSSRYDMFENSIVKPWLVAMMEGSNND